MVDGIPLFAGSFTRTTGFQLVFRSVLAHIGRVDLTLLSLL